MTGAGMMNCSVEELKKKAKSIRLNIVKMVGPGKAGHFGGSCSLAEIVSVLYFRKMRHYPEDPKWEDRDRLILSKGHGAIVQYAALAMCGYFPMDELWNLKKLGSMLQGHPDMKKTPGIEANTGSLGQGLSISCGIAAGAKLDGKDYKVYCIVGDGETAEGQIWEAALAAAHHKLDNVIVAVDWNGQQIDGPTNKVMSLGDLPAKWLSFGWDVYNMEGNNMSHVVACLDIVKKAVGNGKPKVILMKTEMGYGVDFMMGSHKWHGVAPNDEQCKIALNQLEETLGDFKI